VRGGIIRQVHGDSRPTCQLGDGLHCCMRDRVRLEMSTHGAKDFVEEGLAIGQATLLFVQLRIEQSQGHLRGGRLDQSKVFAGKMLGG